MSARGHSSTRRHSKSVVTFSEVHNAEFVLTGVLTQTLDYESYPFGKVLAAERCG